MLKKKEKKESRWSPFKETVLVLENWEWNWNKVALVTTYCKYVYIYNDGDSTTIKKKKQHKDKKNKRMLLSSLIEIVAVSKSPLCSCVHYSLYNKQSVV